MEIIIELKKDQNMKLHLKFARCGSRKNTFNIEEKLNNYYNVSSEEKIVSEIEGCLKWK